MKLWNTSVSGDTWSPDFPSPFRGFLGGSPVPHKSKNTVISKPSYVHNIIIWCLNKDINNKPHMCAQTSGPTESPVEDMKS